MTRKEMIEFAAVYDWIQESKQSIRAKAAVHRGTCAGSVLYSTRPERTADVWEVQERVNAAYKAHDMRPDLNTKDGTNLYFHVFLDAVKAFVSENIEVNVDNRVIFAPRLYKDGSGAYVNVHTCSKEYNRLPNEVELEESPAFLRAKKAKARAKPYDLPDLTAKPKKVGRVTQVHCPNCGFGIVIEDTEND